MGPAVIEALLVGCGNIGALYDIDTTSVSTYARAFQLDPDIRFSAYDTDSRAAYRVAEHYDATPLDSLDGRPLNSYDIVVVATPSATHHHYLERLFADPPRLVVCEKPVDTDAARLVRLVEKYEASGVRVLVNFHRRFQPCVQRLAARVRQAAATDECTAIVVTYQRGLHNNGSHALDLLDLLFERPVALDGLTVLHGVEEELRDDPTLTLAGQWEGAALHVVGLPRSGYSHLDVELFFTRSAFALRAGGDVIELFVTPPATGSFRPLLELEDRWTGCLRESMAHVVAHARRMVADPAIPDNFLQAVSVSQRILNVTRTLAHE